MFLRHFALTFPQKNPWRLLTLPSACKRRLTSTLHSKCCHMAFPPQSSRKTQPPGANGASSVNGWESQPTFKASEIPSLSSRYLPSACAPAFWPPAGCPSRNAQWNSTFVPLGKYLQPCGPATQGTTSWTRSTFGWAGNSPPTPSKIPNNMGPPHPHICPPSPQLRLPRRHRKLTSYQRPGLDHFLLPPRARRVLQRRRRHRPPFIPSPRPPVLHRPATVQRSLGPRKPGHLIPGGFFSLLFTTPKNGVKGESIGHGRTSYPQGCPVAALRCRVTYL